MCLNTWTSKGKHHMFKITKGSKKKKKDSKIGSYSEPYLQVLKIKIQFYVCVFNEKVRQRLMVLITRERDHKTYNLLFVYKRKLRKYIRHKAISVIINYENVELR